MHAGPGAGGWTVPSVFPPNRTSGKGTVGERSPPLNSEHPGGGPEEEELPGSSCHWMGHWGRVWVLVPECKAQKWRPEGALGLGVFCCVRASRGVYLSPSPPLPGGLTGPNPHCHPHPATQWPLPSLGWGSRKSWSCQIPGQAGEPWAVPWTVSIPPRPCRLLELPTAQTGGRGLGPRVPQSLDPPS